MLCLHVTSACASTCDAKNGIHDTKWRCLHITFEFQRMGLWPILCMCICITIDSMLNFDTDAHAHVTCKQDFRARLHQAAALTQSQPCHDASDTAIIENNRVTPEWVAIQFWGNSTCLNFFNETNIASVIAVLTLRWSWRLVQMRPKRSYIWSLSTLCVCISISFRFYYNMGGGGGQKTSAIENATVPYVTCLCIREEEIGSAETE